MNKEDLRAIYDDLERKTSARVADVDSLIEIWIRYIGTRII